MGQLPEEMVSANHWFRCFETYTFLWYLMMVSARTIPRETRASGPFRNLIGHEKPFVKLRPAYSVKLVFSYVINGIKIKISAKFRCIEAPLLWRYKENYVTRNRPEKFRDFRETGPGSHWFEGWIGLFNPLTATPTQQLDRFWKYFSNGWCRINALNRTTHSTRSIKNQTIRYINLKPCPILKLWWERQLGTDVLLGFAWMARYYIATHRRILTFHLWTRNPREKNYF